MARRFYSQLWTILLMTGCVTICAADSLLTSFTVITVRSDSSQTVSSAISSLSSSFVQQPVSSLSAQPPASSPSAQSVSSPSMQQPSSSSPTQQPVPSSSAQPVSSPTQQPSTSSPAQQPVSSSSAQQSLSSSSQLASSTSISQQATSSSSYYDPSVFSAVPQGFAIGNIAVYTNDNNNLSLSTPAHRFNGSVMGFDVTTGWDVPAGVEFGNPGINDLYIGVQANYTVCMAQCAKLNSDKPLQDKPSCTATVFLNSNSTCYAKVGLYGDRAANLTINDNAVLAVLHLY